MNVPSDMRDNPPVECCNSKPKRLFTPYNVTFHIPLGFHLTFSDIGPKTEKEVKEWKKWVVPKKSRWV